MANLSAMRRLGKIAKDRGDNDAALAYYRRVLELEPTDTIARNQLDRLQRGPVKSSPKAIDLAAIRNTMATLLREVELGPAAPTVPKPSAGPRRPRTIRAAGSSRPGSQAWLFPSDT